VVVIAIIGFFSARFVPPAPPLGKIEPLDFNFVRASYKLIASTVHDRRVFLAIIAISIFWAICTVLFVQFTPLAKNVLSASKEVASLFLVIFSVGVAIGSVSINALLKGTVSARYSPIAVIAMGAFLLVFESICSDWQASATMMDVPTFLAHPLAPMLLMTLLGIAVSGGMFVVPLYAFLTTFVEKSQTARTIAANNIVNSGAMVVGALLAGLLSLIGLGVVKQLLVVAVCCLMPAWFGYVLVKAERAAATA
jgi:hypothetical protein